jgi:hypothetical protein
MEFWFLVFLIGFGLFALWLAPFLWDQKRWLTGALTGIGAVALLAYTTLWAIPGLDRPDRSDAEKRLRAQVETLIGEKTALAQDKSVLAQEKITIARERDAAFMAQSKRLETILGESRQVDARRAEMIPATAVRPGTPEPQASNERYDLILGELRHLRDAFGRTAKPEAVSATRDLMQLRDKMGVRMETPHYNVELYPDNEMMKNRAGKYYVVDLKEAKSGIRYYFEGGRYVIDKRNAEFRGSLNKFLGDIVEKLHGKVDYDLLVRGSADGVPMRAARTLEPGHEYRQVRFMKAISGDRYADQVGELKVDTTIRNEDLPQLRAAFLQNVIATAYPVKTPLILEGNVTRASREGDRNAELLLYVQW